MNEIRAETSTAAKGTGKDVPRLLINSVVILLILLFFLILYQIININIFNVKAGGLDSLPVSMRAGSQADYSADPHAYGIPPISENILNQIITEFPATGSPQDRIGTLQAVLLSPVPSTTPDGRFPTATPLTHLATAVPTSRATATPDLAATPTSPYADATATQPVYTSTSNPKPATATSTAQPTVAPKATKPPNPHKPPPKPPNPHKPPKTNKSASAGREEFFTILLAGCTNLYPVSFLSYSGYTILL